MELARSEGIHVAALLDPVGRVIAQAGFSGRDALVQAATLAASLHVVAGRVGRLVGDAGAPRVVLASAGRTLRVLPLPGDHGLLLLVVCGGLEMEPAALLGIDRLAEAVEVARRASVGTEDPEAFELSLLDSLDRVFPSVGPDEERSSDA
jgi:hypothetical protein